MDIKKVGIVGAGQMGNGIAHVFASAGYDVLLNDISQDNLDKALAIIERNLDRQLSRGKISAEDKAAALARITTTVTLTDLGPSDLIIEAATERETVKQAIFEDLLPHLKPDTILTSNTSSISWRSRFAVSVAAPIHSRVTSSPIPTASRAWSDRIRFMETPAGSRGRARSRSPSSPASCAGG